MSTEKTRFWTFLRRKEDLAADPGLRTLAKRQLQAWRWGLLGLLAALAAGELLWGRRGDGLPFVLLGLAFGLFAINHQLEEIRRLDSDAG